MYGFTGKVLIADLTDGTCAIEDLNLEWAGDYLGGPALGARYLYDLMPANTPVFAPESVLGFVTGPLNDTKSFMGGRYTVVCKSPVTGGFNDSSSGGEFAVHMKRSGFDAIFVKGISKTPVYLFIDDGNAEIRDASAIWGLKTLETEAALKEETGCKDICAALIGPGGERMSYMAAIMNDGHRAAGRGGSGAVMGSKRLKAVVCRGTYKVQVKDPDEITRINRSWKEYSEGPIAGMMSTWGAHGTASNYESAVFTSDAGIKNWGGVPAGLSDEQVQNLTGASMDNKYFVKKVACNSCPVGCGAMLRVKSGNHDFETARPEYETLGSFGSMLLNGDEVSVNICNMLCNEYGYDTISFGATIAWLTECYENGLFTIDELDGIDLRWGNSSAIVAMAERICDYKGIGAALNGASRKASEILGRGSEFLTVAGGIEPGHHCARNNPAMARTFTFDPTPGRHVKGGRGVGTGFAPPEVKYNFDGTGEQDKAGVIRAEFDNLSGVCHFNHFLERDAKYKYLSAVTGNDLTEEYLSNLGLRSFTIRSAFNIREGLRRRDCTISERLIGKPPLTDGPLAGVTIDIEKLGDNFYEALGWDVETGTPTKEFLEKVGGLEAVIRDMYPE